MLSTLNSTSGHAPHQANSGTYSAWTASAELRSWATAKVRRVSKSASAVAGSQEPERVSGPGAPGACAAARCAHDGLSGCRRPAAARDVRAFGVKYRAGVLSVMLALRVAAAVACEVPIDLLWRGR